MMAAALFAVAAGLAVALFLHARRRAREYREAVRNELRSTFGKEYPELDVGAALDRDSDLLRVAERRATGDERLALCRAFAARLALTAAPLAEEFDLKIHGPRLVPTLISSDFLELLPERRQVPTTAIADTGLYAIYTVSGEGEGDGALSYLVDDHLRAVGVDRRDIHGIAIAVLRQRFEPADVAELPATGALRVRTTGLTHTAAALLVLGESLGPGETLFAAVPRSDRLWLAAEPGDRHPFDEPPSVAAIPLLGSWLRVSGREFEIL